MKIVIPGGTGQVGAVLARAFHADGHDVVLLSRHTESLRVPWRVARWDGRSPGNWIQELDGADVVINLAGQSVNCRYHAKNRRLIMESRIESTRVLGEALASCDQPPPVWLQASTATIYEHRFDAPNDEASGILGGNEQNAPDTWRFSIDVATNWERVASEAAAHPRLSNTRLLLMRTAMLMSPDRGGTFDVLLRLVRWSLGGKVGDGRQFVSWIHDQDFVRAVHWLVAHDQLSGPVNLASPNPLPYSEFMRELRATWGRRFALSATKWMLEIGTFLMRTESELVLKSRRVVPTRLVESDFTFQFATWPIAAVDLCQRWRCRRASDLR